MSRVLLLGRAGAGKTHACLVRLVAALEARKRAVLLVPTYGQAEHLRYELLNRAGGVGARSVETFTSLAEHVARQRLGALVSAPERDRVAARVLAKRFPDASTQAGFRAEFLRVVKELKEQGGPLDEIRELAVSHYPAGSRESDLFLSCADYMAELPDPDHEDLLLRTRDHLRERGAKLDVVLVDGFHDFTPVQRDVLDLLAARASETVVTLPMHLVSARTTASFLGFETQRLQENRRAEGALAHLERRLSAVSKDVAPAEDIEVIACASEEDEADRLARLVARSERPYKDFLIVRRSFAGLHPVYRAAFARYGIPLRFFGAESLGRIPAARAVSLWLRRKSLPMVDLLPMLRSPYLLDRPDHARVDALAKHLRERGEPATLDDFPAIRDVLERTSPMPFGMRDALVGRADGDEDIARSATFFAALKKERAACDEPEHLLRRIALMQGAVRDRRNDCVYAVNADEARQWEKPVVCVAGLTADAFPQQVRQDIFLRDDERQRLAEEYGLHLPLRKLRENEERYLFYVALTRARERLVLTYAAYDEEGTARAPSPYLDDALGAFDSVARRDVKLSEQFVQAADAVRSEDLLPIVADGLRHTMPLALSLYDSRAVSRDQLAWPRRLELLRKRAIAGVHFKHLSPSAMRDYERCPFLYLVTKLMRLRRPRSHGLDPLVSGSLAHEALDRYVKDGGDAGEIFDDVFATGTAGMRLGIDDEAMRQTLREAVVNTVRDIVREDVLETERFIEPTIAGVPMRGRIDRVDRCGEGKLIVDYKTGSSKWADLRQLDCYVLAEEGAVGAVFDFIKSGRRTGYVLEGAPVSGRGVKQLTPQEFAQRRAETEDAIVHVAEAVKSGRLAVGPREPEQCTRTRCEGYDLCRVARARWLAKGPRE